MKTDFYWFAYIIFLLFYVIFKPNRIIQVDFYCLMFLSLIIYLIIFKRLYLIKNSIFLKKEEKNDVIIGTALFIAIIIICLSIRIESLAPIFEISIYTLFQTLTEELVIRVFLLGAVIEKFSLTKIKEIPFYYWTNGKKNGIILFAIMLLISILFADLHTDWLTSNLYLIIRTVSGFIYASAFVFTNKKIYAPWLIHYIYNMYAFYGIDPLIY